MFAPQAVADTLIDHLVSFQPSQAHNLLVASWAIRHADAGSWLSTTMVDGQLVTAATVVEQLRLDPWLDHSDPWAPVLSD